MQDRGPAIVFVWDVDPTFAWYPHSAFKTLLVTCVKTYAQVNANKLRCMASSISTVNNLGEIAGKSEMDNICFLYSYDSNVLGPIRRLLEPHLHSNLDSRRRLEYIACFIPLLIPSTITVTLYFRQKEALWLAR